MSAHTTSDERPIATDKADVTSSASASPLSEVPTPATGETRVDTGEPAADQAEMRMTSRGAGRWWVAVLVGLVIAVPLAWLLSYAGTLPFFLGLFFFVLFGIMVGALMHRVAAKSRPYSVGTLCLGTTAVVLFVIVGSIVNEARDFPGDTAKRAANQTRTLEGQSFDEFCAQVAQRVRGFLREQYPPGGTVGYVRWIVTSGELRPAQVAGLRRPLNPRQYGFAWAVRVVLSAALLAFGVASQTLPLRLARDPVVRTIDEHAGRNDPA